MPAPPADDPSRPPVVRGTRALRDLLRDHTLDLRGLDLPGFRTWLDLQLARWNRDPVFVQRARIRDLRRAHPGLRALEEEERQAARADAASPHAERLRRLEQELTNTALAITGLTGALERDPPERWPALRRKRQDFRARQRALREEQARLVRASPERQALRRLRAKLARLRAALGLDHEEARLQELQRQRGHRSGARGDTFEELARALIHERLVPELSPRGGAELRVLHGVTLGAAGVELDALVVRPAARPGRPAEALAVVEVKRNVNDLAHGFRRRQEDLAWLTGTADAYDPAAHRTRRFPSGHFDRPAEHRQDGETFLLTQSSFRRFRRDAACGRFLGRLYFITRPGPVWGVSAAVLARIGAHVAADERWVPDDPAYLDELRRWCQALAGPLETPDVLRTYAAEARRARQILLVGRYG